MKKLKAGAVVKSVAKRIVHPGHLVRAVKLQRGRKKAKRAFDDTQLELMARILPSGYLHYGYFDDPDRIPEEISINDVGRAQHRYAELLLEHATDRSSPVLDVGCGMGGLVKLLLERGFAPTALTPDRLQAAHVRKTYPDVPVIQSTFEALPDADQQAARYGTVLTSESLQYLELDLALPLLAKVLKPGGKWIACDYFRNAPDAAGNKAGHEWAVFQKKLAEHGWTIRFERDITAHILPTLRYIHMWATRFGLPVIEFGLLKLRVKQPALHYLLEDSLKMLDTTIARQLQAVDPKLFAENKRYIMLVMQRTAD